MEQHPSASAETSNDTVWGVPHVILEEGRRLVVHFPHAEEEVSYDVMDESGATQCFVERRELLRSIEHLSPNMYEREQQVGELFTRWVHSRPDNRLYSLAAREEVFLPAFRDKAK